MMMMRFNRLIANVIFIVGVMTITGGCTTDAVEPTEQLKLSSTPPLLGLCHVNQEKHMSDWRRRAMPAG